MPLRGVHKRTSLGAIGEKTTAWNFSLPDGTNTPRQLSNGSGAVTLLTRYTPWGDTLEVNGTGNFAFGYFGGVMDAATGLIYVGNGQYYDPETGRFLTRDAKPNNSNPYVPWDPTGAIIGPLAAMALFFGRRRKYSKWDSMVILLVLSLSIGLSLTACQFTVGDKKIEVAKSPTQPDTFIVTVMPTTDIGSGTPDPGSGTLPITYICSVSSTSTPIDALTSGYYIPTESQAQKYYGGIKVPIPAPDWAAAEYLVKYEYRTSDREFSHDWAEYPAQYANEVLLYDYNYTCLQGSGQLDNGQFIKCDTTYTWNDYIPQGDGRRDQVAFRWAGETDSQLLRSLKPFNTVAGCDTSGISGKIQLRGLPEASMKVLAQHGNSEAIFDVVDVGQGLCPQNSNDGKLRVDIFTGIGEQAFMDARDYFFDKPIQIYTCN